MLYWALVEEEVGTPLWPELISHYYPPPTAAAAAAAVNSRLVVFVVLVAVLVAVFGTVFIAVFIVVVEMSCPTGATTPSPWLPFIFV